MVTNKIGQTDQLGEIPQNSILSKKELHPFLKQGIWMLTITNDPKKYLKEMDSKFMGESTMETAFIVDNDKQGITMVNEIARVIGDNCYYQGSQAPFDKNKTIYLAIHIYFKKPTLRNHTAIEIIDWVRMHYDQSKRSVFPSDLLIPSKPFIEIKIVNDPDRYFEEMKGKFKGYEPVLEYSYLASTMSVAVKAVNDLSEGYGETNSRLHSVNSDFRKDLPVFVSVHIYFKKPLSRSRNITNLANNFEVNYRSVISSEFIGKDIMAEPRGSFHGKWAVCLTNNPEQFWRKIRKQKGFWHREWGKKAIPVKNIGEGIKATKAFIIKHGGHPTINSYEPTLDINKPMYMAVFVSYE